MAAHVVLRGPQNIFILSLILGMPRVSACNRFDRRAFFGTKTAYDSIFNHTTRRNLDEQDLIYPPNCEVLQLNMVIRHGSRYPSHKDITKFNTFLEEKIKNKVTSEKYNKLNNWANPFNLDLDKKLASNGVIEMQDIAKRFQRHYLKLPATFSAKEIRFISSDTQRSIASADAFRSGIIKATNSTMSYRNIDIGLGNKMLRFYDYCKKFVSTVEKNKTALAEFYKFIKGPVLVQFAEIVTARLGLRDGLKLTTGDLKVIATIEAFEEIIYGSSIWDGLLHDEELDALQYATDLKCYWRKAYGYDLNYLQSCPLVGDIFYFMEQAIKADQGNGRVQPKGIFRFGHAETIFPLIALFGLYKDATPLTADNYAEQHNRNFRSSLIAPMSANVAIVLLKCDPDAAVLSNAYDWPEKFSKYMVQVLVNEQPQKFPFCQHSICSYEKVAEKYGMYVNDCPFDDMCENGEDDEEDDMSEDINNNDKDEL